MLRTTEQLADPDGAKEEAKQRWYFSPRPPTGGIKRGSQGKDKTEQPQAAPQETSWRSTFKKKLKIAMKVVTCGKGLPKEAVKSPPLEPFKTGLASTPGHLLGTCSAWEVGPRNPQESSPG